MPDTSFIDRKALSAVFKDSRTLLAFEKLMQMALTDNPASIDANFLMPNLVAYFGGVGDSVTNNDAAFTAAEASGYAQIYLPDGEFVSTLAQSAFTKRYWGPGKIVLPAATMPGRFSYIATTPALWPSQGATGFFRGGTTAAEPEWHVIGPNTREYLGARYFEAGFIPHPVWSEVYSGASGLLTQATGALAIGATSAALISAAGISVGNTVGLTPYGMDGAITDTITIDTIVGATITFHPALTTAYPNVTPDGVTPGRAVLMKGHRTWGGVRYAKITNYADGGGDVYGDIARMVQGYQPKAGQTHVFETSTVGQYGGSIDFNPGSSGCGSSGWESMYADHGEDVSVIAQIDSFSRDNDTGARSVFWFGTLFKSEGSKPVDACHVMAGKFRVGIDTVLADLTTNITAGDNINAAINTAIGHRWVMNSTASNTGRSGSGVGGRWPPLYGNTPGDMYIESGSDGTSDFISMRFNRAAGSDGRLRLRPTGLQVNVPILGGSTVEAAAQLVCGGAIPQVVFRSGSGIWIEDNGVNLRATRDGGATWTNIV